MQRGAWLNIAATFPPRGRTGPVAAGGAITQLPWQADNSGIRSDGLKEGRRRLAAFLDGELRAFDLPPGTGFRLAVRGPAAGDILWYHKHLWRSGAVARGARHRAGDRAGSRYRVSVRPDRTAAGCGGGCRPSRAARCRRPPDIRSPTAWAQGRRGMRRAMSGGCFSAMRYYLSYGARRGLGAPAWSGRIRGALGLIGGAGSVGACWIAVRAMTVAPIAPVTARREAPVLFAVLIGMVLRKDRADGRRLFAARLSVVGVTLTRV